MTGEAGTPASTFLHHEHELLGATFSSDAFDVLVPDFYGGGEGEPAAFDRGCALTDVSSLRTFVMAGASAEAFVGMVFTAACDVVGDLAPSLVLAGDGTVVACVLLARTGDEEFVAWCPSELAHVLATWLDGIAAIEQDGFAPFRDLVVEQTRDRAQSLLLAGPGTEGVLGDYLAPGSELPGCGCLIGIELDDIDCLVGRVALEDDVLTLVSVPTARAVSLWRSLLSFQEVTPVGVSALWARIGLTLPGVLRLVDEPSAHLTPQELGLESLLRNGGSFVGARALEADEQSSGAYHTTRETMRDVAHDR